jgi:hypothetical protein
MGTIGAVAPERNFDDAAARAGVSNGAASPGNITEDDLLSHRVEVVLFGATMNCNLRCTYCAVSLPYYVGEDFDFFANRKACRADGAGKG